MPDQIYIGNFSQGLTTNPLAFNIDNDAFPYLYNFYIWRQRALRKRGTLPLARAERQVQIAADPLNWQYAPINLVAGAGNLITQLSLGTSASITPLTISLSIGGQTYTDLNADGTLQGSGGGSGTINYSTGTITIVGGGVDTVTGFFSYYPGLPALGARDFLTLNSFYPVLLSFDQNYAYQIQQTAAPFNFYSVSYYKYTNNPVIWSGADYQQFWTTNYSGALWATNNKPGFHFVNGTYVSGSGTTTITFSFTSASNPFTTLIVGDKLWFNEWGSNTINGVVGTVSTVTGTPGTYVVTFQNSLTASGTGIAQLLSNSIPGQDGIKWYDGDMTGGTGIPTSKSTGWVNFAPPLTATTVSIDNTPAALYYLVGALAIMPFKDRIVFFSPYIQTSAGGPPILLQDTALWSWNGTPYYTLESSTVFDTPSGETADVTAYYVDTSGKGGYLPAGLPQPIITVNNNEDVLLVGFSGIQTRFVYTGNDLQPFLFFSINSELGSSATFSGVSLDRGGVTVGQYGITLTTQQSAQRIDLQIPDSVFQIQAENNGPARVSGIRDYYREWIYFAYPADESAWKFPTKTFLYNYRNDTWAVFYENFTCHGNFRKQTGYTWGNLPYNSWADWNEAWNSGTANAYFPDIVAGNPQGYFLIKGIGTGEAPSGSIQAVSDASGITRITSANHCVAVGDYLQILDCLGTISLNGQIGMVISTADANTFTIDIPFPAGTYLGLGTYTRLIQPMLQTKQFPVYWEEGRKVRLSIQKYLFDTTAQGQVTAYIYLSQDGNNPWNIGSIVPDTDPEPTNSSLTYSQLIYTCPESTNLGLTPANVNLQMPTASTQDQTWHRYNTSLIGDSIQIGITLNDAQMRNITTATSEIALHGIHLVVEKSQHLA